MIEVFVLTPFKSTKSIFNPVHVFLHFGTFCLVVLQLILASKLSELEQFEIRKQITSQQPKRVKIRHEKKTMPLLSFRKGACGQGEVLLTVKLNIKGRLLSCILLQDAAICQKIHICLKTGNLLPNFQIALTHSILKLKSIVITLNQMSRSGEKYAQD